MAAGIYAEAYVPTASEWLGDLSSMQGLLLDPFSAVFPAPGVPFAGGIIPISRIPLTFAWRINSHTARLPVTSTASLRFVPVTPCRIADTRGATGSFGAPALASQATRDFPIPNSPCGIPGSAQTYSLNFTVVPQNKLDYLTVFPTGQQPPLASVLNSYDGRIKANAALIPAGVNGGVSVFATDATDLVIDIDGYFVPDTNTAALAFYPMTPCRIADTRGDSGILGAPALAAGEERTFPILSSSCAVPAEAQAYSLNYTVVPQGPLSYLTTWPTGQTRPLVSTLNSPTGTITANAAIVPAGDGGNVSVYVTDPTQLIVDIDGYFAPPTSSGLSLYNLAPCRIYDSRTGANANPLIGHTTVEVGDTACGQLPAARSFVLNSTVVPTGSLLYLTLWSDGGGFQPNASVLNAPDGTVTSNLAIVPTKNGSISAFASGSTHLILDITGYFAP